MPKTTLDHVTEDMLYLFPLMYKKLLHAEQALAQELALTLPLHVMAIIKKRGPVSMSTIGGCMGISKPRMTAIADQLIKDGLAAREKDPDDRRVINIQLTAKGKQALDKGKAYVRSQLKIDLEQLPKEDIDALHKALATSRKIIMQLHATGEN